jgi:hypothetical protein
MICDHLKMTSVMTKEELRDRANFTRDGQYDT